MPLTGPIAENIENNLKHEVIFVGQLLLAPAMVVKVTIPYAHKVIKLRSQVTIVAGSGDQTVTLKNTSGTAYTGGVLTIAATAAVDVRDTSTEITGGTQTQAKDTDVQIVSDGNSASGEASFWLEIERDDS